MASSITPAPPGFLVRDARDDDAPALAELFWRVRAESASTIPPIVHPRDMLLPFLRSVLATSRVWVAAAHTGAGLGRHLVELAQQHSPEGLSLWVFASNVGAVRFYERLGFVVVGGTDGDNEEGAPDLRMTWSPA